jgi:hypothetical protein
MEREELRRERYHLLAFDQDGFEELCSLTAGRNQLVWYRTNREPTGVPWREKALNVAMPEMEFEFNGLWFQLPFELTKF